MSRSDEKVFTLGSLFAGIGGIELGLEMTGRFKTVWQVEQSEYCRKVLRRHWPDALQFEDVRDVGKGNLPAVDVICGGFPCQDISSAGKRAGIREGTRSGLWFEYARIVRELRPSFVVVENVSALLSGGLGIVLGELASLGYDAQWSMLSARDVGAPHLRERVFVVAYSDSYGGRLKVGPQQHRQTQQAAADGYSRGRHSNGLRLEVADTDGAGLEGRISAGLSQRSGERTLGASGSFVGDPASSRLPNWTGGTLGQPCPVTEPKRPGGREIERDFRGMAHGVSRRVDRLRALGNAVVPQCARVIGEWLLEIDAELNQVGAA